MEQMVQFGAGNPAVHESLWSHETTANLGRPKVSVCMPAHRNSAWFQQALRSALDQSMSDFEIVITDDSG
ncbi:MAG TPA: glycosyltransferase, partial [Terriglobales bacterium]|nr:glycosyltransferase [Terriglobales bacterium]